MKKLALTISFAVALASCGGSEEPKVDENLKQETIQLEEASVSLEQEIDDISALETELDEALAKLDSLSGNNETEITE